MLVTWKQNVKRLTQPEYSLLRRLCRLSKNVYNESLYNIRQHWATEGTYLRYESNYHVEKVSNNYKLLGSDASCSAMRCADSAFKSFFSLVKLKRSGNYASKRVKLPSYLPKQSFFSLQYGHAKIRDGYFYVPISHAMRLETDVRPKIKVPRYVLKHKVHQIHVIPKNNAQYFEVRYIFEVPDLQVPNSTGCGFLAIDLGVNNFATCVTDKGHSFIVDGKELKSINQGYNKEIARLSSIANRQGYNHRTRRQYLITRKRNNRVQDFICCAAKYIVKYCLGNNIGTIVVGYNDGFTDNPNLGRVNNQNFVMIPFGKFKSRLEYLCKQRGINYVEQEESYTSKASFFDNDEMPKWNPRNPTKATFSGERVKRGLYQTKSGKLVNADVNAALNILRKSNLTDLSVLQARGYGCEPCRVRYTKLRQNHV